MKYSVILSALGSASLALAHGLVTQLEVGGALYDNYSPYVDPYRNPKPERIGWTTPSNGPVEDVTTAGIACNTGSTAGALTAEATAGSEVKFFWTVWPDSHRGPTMTYLAKCPDTDCTTADPTTLDWFKINDAGLNSDGTWASDTLIANNNTWTVTIPSDIASGPYLLRHELLALHAASGVNGAQFYPMCANLQITGSGSAVPADTVKFPGAYSPTDPGILINIYYPVVKNYTIPGPAVYTPGGSSASSSVIIAPTTSATATSVAATSTSEADVTFTSGAITPTFAVPTFPTLSGTAPIGTGPATFPTIIPSIVPPYANTTVTRTRTHTGRPSSKTIAPTRSFTFAPVDTPATISEATSTVEATAAETTTGAPGVTITRVHTHTHTHTETATVEKTVILTFTASAVETVTVPAECTPVGKHRRGTYYF